MKRYCHQKEKARVEAKVNKAEEAPYNALSAGK
jgi:hypothetical protein